MHIKIDEEVARAEVERAFGKRFFIPFAEGCEFLGLCTKTVRNQMSAGKVHLPLIQQGARLFFSSPQLAHYIAVKTGGSASSESPATAPVSRSKGRPKKGLASFSTAD